MRKRWQGAGSGRWESAPEWISSKCFGFLSLYETQPAPMRRPAAEEPLADILSANCCMLTEALRTSTILSNDSHLPLPAPCLYLSLGTLGKRSVCYHLKIPSHIHHTPLLNPAPINTISTTHK